MVEKDAKYVYFTRLPECGIPSYERKDDTDAEMPNYFIIGSTSGRLLTSLDNLLNGVYMPVIKKQFAEPIMAKAKVTAKKQDRKASLVQRRSSELTNLKRPSDYRRIAIRIQKEKQKAAQRFLLADGEEESVVSEIASEDDLIGSSPIKQELVQDLESIIDTISWFCAFFCLTSFINDENEWVNDFLGRLVILKMILRVHRCKFRICPMLGRKR